MVARVLLPVARPLMTRAMQLHGFAPYRRNADKGIRATKLISFRFANLATFDTILHEWRWAGIFPPKLMEGSGV